MAATRWLLLLLARGAGAGPSRLELERRERCASKYPPEALAALRVALLGGGPTAAATQSQALPRVFFAALLHNNAPVLEGWMEALDRTIDMLGPSRSYVSILESGSTDGTNVRLNAWSAALGKRGVANTIRTGVEPASVLRPFRTGDTGILRIEFLAKLRNEVLAPMWRDHDAEGATGAASDTFAAAPARNKRWPTTEEEGGGGGRRALTGRAAAELDAGTPGLTTAAPPSRGQNGSAAGGGARFDRLVFLNDVVFCEGDLLRLLVHGSRSHAALACGLDFHHSSGRGESDFYDKWVQTDLQGHHALPPEVGGGAPERLPHKRPGAWLPLRADVAACGSEPPAPCAPKFERPSHVYCCWNGIAVFDAAPFYAGVRFRWAANLDPASPHSGECAASECSLACKDLWRIGYGRVLLDPAVQVAYSHAVHKARVRNFAQPVGAGGGAVPPTVILTAAQPEAWDCYGLADPGARGMRWKLPPVRESLAANHGPLPYRPHWERWPAVVISTSERAAREAERDERARERARTLWRGALYGALAASTAACALRVLLARRGCLQRIRQQPQPAEYARLDRR